MIKNDQNDQQWPAMINLNKNDQKWPRWLNDQNLNFNDLPKREGRKQTQLVNMAPLTTSNSGKTTKVSKAMPTADMASNSKTTKKSENMGFRLDLKMQILEDRNNVPNSGMTNEQVKTL